MCLYFHCARLAGNPELKQSTLKTPPPTFPNDNHIDYSNNKGIRTPQQERQNRSSSRIRFKVPEPSDYWLYKTEKQDIIGFNMVYFVFYFFILTEKQDIKVFFKESPVLSNLLRNSYPFVVYFENTLQRPDPSVLNNRQFDQSQYSAIKMGKVEEWETFCLSENQLCSLIYWRTHRYTRTPISLT